MLRSAAPTELDDYYKPRRGRLELLVMPDFTKVQSVHDKARVAGVSYVMHYCEPDDSYYFSVSSAAPSEEWIGKNHSFDVAVECVCEWLDSLTA